MTSSIQVQQSSCNWILLAMVLVSQPCFAGVSPVKSRIENKEYASVVEVTLDQQPSRIQHAKELLGKNLKKGLIQKAGKVEDLKPFVLELTKKFLPKADKKLARSVTQSIVAEARKYGFDPLFVMAVIQNESSFNRKLMGTSGEIGLMQIKPSTAQWIAQQYKIKYKGAKSLYDPATNVRLGTALMDKLRGQFESQGRLYISAYNIGAKKVRTLVDQDHTPKEYVVAVMKRYLAIYQAFTQKKLEAQTSLAYESVMKLTRVAAAN